MTGLALVFALAVGVERFTDLLKQFSASVTFMPSQYKPALIQLFTSAVGILVAIGAHLDLFQMAHISFSIPYVGSIAMGLIIGRGSNYTHDFFTNFNAVGAVSTLISPIKSTTPPQEAPAQDQRSNGSVG